MTHHSKEDCSHIERKRVKQPVKVRSVGPVKATYEFTNALGEEVIYTTNLDNFDMQVWYVTPWVDVSPDGGEIGEPCYLFKSNLELIIGEANAVQQENGRYGSIKIKNPYAGLTVDELLDLPKKSDA